MFMSRTQVITLSWEELDDYIRQLAGVMNAQRVGTIYPKSYQDYIPSIMLAEYLDTYMVHASNIDSTEFSIVNTPTADMSIYNFTYEDEVKSYEWDGVYCEEIKIQLDEEPPKIVMPWQR